MRPSAWWKRRYCRKGGHDWTSWNPVFLWSVGKEQSARGRCREQRDCNHCHIREIRYGLTSWENKRLLIYRTRLLGRLVEWAT